MPPTAVRWLGQLEVGGGGSGGRGEFEVGEREGQGATEGAAISMQLAGESLREMREPRAELTVLLASSAEVVGRAYECRNEHVCGKITRE